MTYSRQAWELARSCHWDRPLAIEEVRSLHLHHSQKIHPPLQSACSFGGCYLGGGGWCRCCASNECVTHTYQDTPQCNCEEVRSSHGYVESMEIARTQRQQTWQCEKWENERPTFSRMNQSRPPNKCLVAHGLWWLQLFFPSPCLTVRSVYVYVNKFYNLQSICKPCNRCKSDALNVKFFAVLSGRKSAAIIVMIANQSIFPTRPLFVVV